MNETGFRILLYFTWLQFCLKMTDECFIHSNFILIFHGILPFGFWHYINHTFENELNIFLTFVAQKIAQCFIIFIRFFNPSIIFWNIHTLESIFLIIFNHLPLMVFSGIFSGWHCMLIFYHKENIYIVQYFDHIYCLKNILVAISYSWEIWSY